jgi:hypothetical protein
MMEKNTEEVHQRTTVVDAMKRLMLQVTFWGWQGAPFSKRHRNYSCVF